MLVEDAELPDRHLLLGERVERPRSVHRGRVHRKKQAAAETDDEELPEPLARDRVDDVGQPDDAGQVVVETVVADRPDHGDRQQEREDDVERSHRGQGLPRVVGGVLVLRCERRPRFRPVRRPAEDVQPDHDHHELVEERCRVAVELDVRRDEVRVDLVVREVAGHEGADGDDEDGDHHQGADDVAEPDGRPHPADVEDPAEHDGRDPDQLRPAERRDDGRMPRRFRGVEVAPGSELGDQQVPDQAPVDRQHARPREPVAEDRDRPREREVLAPSLARVDGQASRLVREHGGGLAVDVRLERADDGGDDPEDDGHLAPERDDRAPEADQQEAGVGETDDEPVPPPDRLEETSFVYCNFSHAPSSESRDALAGPGL